MIPKLHYISQGNCPEAHLDAIEKVCRSGAELVQLRLKDLDEADLLKTAEQTREITNTYQTRLIINDYYKIAKTVKADGVHLGKTDACPMLARKHLYSWQIVGGTANTLEDCEVLLEKNVDYMGLGPFRFTQTKKKLSPILGLSGYTRILKILKTDIPIIAIGGITSNDVPEILATGIYGVAVSQELTSNHNQINHFHQLLQAPSQQAKVWKLNQSI